MEGGECSKSNPHEPDGLDGNFHNRRERERHQKLGGEVKPRTTVRPHPNSGLLLESESVEYEVQYVW